MFDDGTGGAPGGMGWGSGFSAMGQGWSGIPGATVTEDGVQSGGGGPGAASPWMPSGGTARAVATAIMHPTARQVVFFAAAVLLVLAWRGHLKSMVE